MLCWDIARTDMNVRIGLGQIRVSGGRPRANLDRACRAVAEAAERSCDLVLLPECLDLGWMHPSARERAEPIPGRFANRIMEAAARHALYVVAGLVERDAGRLFNAAVLVGPDGRILLRHRKINELEMARSLYDRGDRLGVAETEYGRVAVNICADNFEDSLEIARAQARMGARLLLAPSSWVVRPDHDEEAEPYEDRWLPQFRTLTRESGLVVASVSHVGAITAGPWIGRTAIGRSLLVDRDGEVVARGPYGVDAEDFLVAEVDLGD